MLIRICIPSRNRTRLLPLPPSHSIIFRLLLIILLGAQIAWSAENLLKDGGFEQYLAQPDEQGNLFEVWSGWKWEGNCRRVADTDIQHEGHASGSMLSYGPCKLGISQIVRTEAAWYRLSGWVRAIGTLIGSCWP